MTAHFHYRGAILARAKFGHVNVWRASDGGFVGGYANATSARRAVDSMADRHAHSPGTPAYGVRYGGVLVARIYRGDDR